MYNDLRNLTKVRSSKMFVNEDKKVIVCIVGTALGYFEGKATCSPKDTFDIVVGKKIAYNRALRQANAHLKVFVRENFIVPAQKIIDGLQYNMDKSANIIKEELDKLDTIAE